MKIHLYDFLGKNKIKTFDTSDFLSLSITHNIDDFSTLTLGFGIVRAVNETGIGVYQNIYVEDDEGRIIFGGIITGFSTTAQGGTFKAIDHRWIFSKLILDAEMNLTSSEDVLDVVEDLINAAKAKREIPVFFNREGSAISDQYQADLTFSRGDDIGSSLQKIIQSIYARWAVRYTKVGNEVIGFLIVRSVRGVSPEGVGIARSIHQSEDGTIVKLSYEEGSQQNTIHTFNVNYDAAPYVSRATLGVKLGEDQEPTFVNAAPDGFSAFFESNYGRTEAFSTDYKVASLETAQQLSGMNQVYPTIDVQIQPTPDFTPHLNCGDRVLLAIKSPLVELPGNTVRVDSVSYTMEDGYLTRSISLNLTSMQKRPGTGGILKKINDMDTALDDLGKHYFNRG